MTRVWLGFLLLGASAWAGQWNIFGTDYRQVLPAGKWPAAALGQVSGRFRCTGTLVGPRIVLTAAHCLRFQGNQLDPNRPPTFAAQVFQGQSTALNLPEGIAVEAGTWRSDQDPRSEDWAVIALAEAPRRADGRPYRWLEVHSYQLTAGDLVSTVGYSLDIQGGRSPSVHRGCQVRESFPEGFFFHDCAIYAGASGGPVLLDFLDPTLSRATPVVVGITNAHFSDGTPGLTLPAYSADRANVGAPASAFYQAVQNMARKYPVRVP